MSMRSSPPHHSSPPSTTTSPVERKALLSSFESSMSANGNSSPLHSPRPSPTSPRYRLNPSAAIADPCLLRPSRTRQVVGVVFLLVATIVLLTNHYSLVGSNVLLEETDDGGVISSDVENAKKKPPRYSILPKKFISVIGLESSGTQFVSKIFEEALRTGPYREGSLPCYETCTDDTLECERKKTLVKNHECVENNREVQVQHFSLPWGATCILRPNPPIVNVVLPPQCSREQTDPIEIKECNAMSSDVYGIQLNGKPMIYPKRYQLDITSHKLWYDEQGVEQIFIIVMRDKTISYAARRDHCANATLRKQEDDVGKELIIHAINTFILDSDDDDDKVTKTTFTHWIAKHYQHIHNDGSNDGGDDGKHVRRRRLPSSMMSNNNNVVVVSYETLIQLDATYIKMILSSLGIKSNFLPKIKDSNRKYVNDTLIH